MSKDSQFEPMSESEQEAYVRLLNDCTTGRVNGRDYRVDAPTFTESVQQIKDAMPAIKEAFAEFGRTLKQAVEDINEAMIERRP